MPTCSRCISLAANSLNAVRSDCLPIGGCCTERVDRMRWAPMLSRHSRSISCAARSSGVRGIVGWGASGQTSVGGHQDLFGGPGGHPDFF